MRRVMTALVLLLPAALAAAPTSAGPVRAGRAGTVPVVVIVMENHGYQGIVGNANAPFINKTLIPGGMLDTHYLGGPGSLPDYLVMIAGAPAAATSAPNLFTALGSTTPWKEFMESMPSACYLGSTFGVVDGTQWGLYTRYHNPALHFSAVDNTSLCSSVVPLDLSHFNPPQLPAFSYVVPNECNDMHTQPASGQCPMWNGTTNTAANPVRMGDNWLAAFVPAVARYATVIITWDEAAPSNEQVATIIYGAGVTAGQDSTAYSHSSLEAGLYAHFGLGTAPGSGAAATALPLP